MIQTTIILVLCVALTASVILNTELFRALRGVANSYRGRFDQATEALSALDDIFEAADNAEAAWISEQELLNVITEWANYFYPKSEDEEDNGV